MPTTRSLLPICLAALATAAVSACDTGECAAPRESASSTPDSRAEQDGGIVGVDQCGNPIRAVRTGPGEVLTSKNDNGRTGANTGEKVLDHASVKSLELVATLPVDGELYAQPLVVADVATPSGTRSLLIAATMNDSVFAFDVDAADGAPPVWTAGASRELGEPGRSSRNVYGPNGILSTPVVDRARGLLWAVARDCSKTEKTTFDRCGTPTEVPKCRERLVSLDLGTGAMRGDVDIGGGGWSGTRYVGFDPSVHWNRPALLLAGDSLYVAFGSGPNANDHEEDYEYHGWLFRYDASSLANAPSVFVTTPGSSGGSIWQSGAGPAADDANVYFVTANPILGCTTHAPAGFPPAPADAEDSIVSIPQAYATTDLRAAGAARAVTSASELGTVSSYAGARVYSDTRAYSATSYSGTVFQFTASGDCGFGSSGPTLIPDSSDLVVATKGGLLYLLDKTTMAPRQAPLSPFDRLALQGDHSLYIHSWWGIPFVPGSLAFHRPAEDHGLVYGWAKDDVLRSFRYDYAAHTLVPDRVATVDPNKYGGYLSVSSDGTRPDSALLWATTSANGDTGKVMAFDAGSLAPLFSADLPAFSKFTPPTVARGRVFVPSAKDGAKTAVLVYGVR